MKKHDITIRIKRTLKNTPERVWIEATIHKVIDVLEMQETVEFGLLITDDKDIKKLNARYRNINQPTDVLSFSAGTDQTIDIDFIQPPDGMHHLGDVVISYEQVIAQAQEDETTPKAVLVALIVHGFLHLLGYDHETETEACIMEEKETEILATLNSI